MPHWPAPWGRGASPLEQLVIDEELAAAGVPRPHLAVGAWALPTIIAHGTAEQQERWVRPTLLGRARAGASSSASPVRAPTSPP